MAASVFSGAHTQDPRCAISEILGMVRINAFCFSDKCLVSTFSQAVKRRIIMKAMITSNRKNIYVYFVFMLVGVNIFIVITKIQYIFVYQLFLYEKYQGGYILFRNLVNLYHSIRVPTKFLIISSISGCKDRQHGAFVKLYACFLQKRDDFGNRVV